MAQEIGRAEAAELVRSAGLRLTSPRLWVLQVLSALQSPVSHAEMIGKLVDYEIDEATVFRCLNDLSSAGIVRRLELGDRTFRFELIRSFGSGSPHSDEPHPHFICTDCGKIVCLPSPVAFRDEDLDHVRKTVGEVTEVLLKGLCHSCRR